jgi:hypothetical protein
MATGRSRSLVERTRKRFVSNGLEIALWDKPRPGKQAMLNERGRGTLIALTCTNLPEGRTCWTMQLLASELVVRQVCHRSQLRSCGGSSKKRTQAVASGTLVHPGGRSDLRSCDGGRARAVRRAFDRERPVVGFDEQPLQLVAETHTPLPAAPCRPRRMDYEYRGNATCNLVTTVEPLTGWRYVEVTERRTAVDFAHQMKWLVDEAYPDARLIRVVLDNLNVHALASLLHCIPGRRGAKDRPEARVPLHTQTRE